MQLHKVKQQLTFAPEQQHQTYQQFRDKVNSIIRKAMDSDIAFLVLAIMVAFKCYIITNICPSSTSMFAMLNFLD
jgi:hypothetical protein